MFLTVWLIPILLIAAVAYAFGWRPEPTNPAGFHGNRQTPMDVLKERYARGEIGREEYVEMRRGLEI